MIIPNDFHVCNHQLEAMNLDPLASYVKQREGQRVIRKILISNNGMAAVKARSSDRLPVLPCCDMVFRCVSSDEHSEL